jgi:hypothetical protein
LYLIFKYKSINSDNKLINLINLILFYLEFLIYIWTNLLENLMCHIHINYLLEIKMGWLIKYILIVNKF